MFPISAIVQSAPNKAEGIQRPPLPAASPWIAGLEGRRGMLLLVGYAPGWQLKGEDSFLQDVADELAVVMVSPKDPLVRRLGLQAPGAYLLNEFGRSLGGWNAGVPEDLRKAFEALGWRPLETELNAFLKSHPERLDVRWRLVQKVWNRAVRRPSDAAFENLAETLEAFFRQEGWAQLPSQGFQPLFPAKAEHPVGPLADLARNRLERVRDAVVRDPEATLAWEMLYLLSPWVDGPEPRLYRFLEDLESPPMPFRYLGDWPRELPVKWAELQLRRLQDWAGLEAFAASRRGRLEGRFLQSTQDLPAPWGARFQEPGQPTAPPGFLQEAVRDVGRWQLLELEAQLEQGHAGAAGNTASLILRDGDRSTLVAARSLARRLKAEAVLKALEE